MYWDSVLREKDKRPQDKGGWSTGGVCGQVNRGGRVRLSVLPSLRPWALLAWESQFQWKEWFPRKYDNDPMEPGVKASIMPCGAPGVSNSAGAEGALVPMGERSRHRGGSDWDSTMALRKSHPKYSRFHRASLGVGMSWLKSMETSTI